MTPEQLLHNLKRCGVMVRIAQTDPTALDLNGPRSAMTVVMLDAIRHFKPDLLAILRERQVIRRHVAALIRQAHNSNRDVAIKLRDTWHERVAIVTIDGGLTDIEAERIAAIEIKSLTTQYTIVDNNLP